MYAKPLTIGAIIISSIGIISYGTIFAYQYATTTTLEDVTKQVEAFEKAKSELQEIRIKYCNDSYTGKINYDKCGEELNNLFNTGTATGASIPVPLGQVNVYSIAMVAEMNGKQKSYDISKKPQLQQTNIVKNAGVGTSYFWQTYDLAIPLIRKHEGLRLKAYPDPVKCSIGYGTRAKSCSEVITQVEADLRLGSIVKQLINRVQKDFPTLNAKQQAGLVSFAFNCHSGYRDVVNRGLDKHKYWCRTASGVKLQGLVNRRLEEQILIFN